MLKKRQVKYMADGKISIDVVVDNKPVDVAAKSLDNLEASGQGAGKGVKNTEDGLKSVGNESQKASGNIKKLATSLGLVALGAAAFKVLKNSMDDAIARFDTMKNFPKVMEQVGFSAEDSERAINKLSDGIEGLPTKLEDVTSTAQKLAVMTGDLDGAVDATLALNNAFLASGASTADAERGLTQYIQMLSKGEVDMTSWRTLQETMGVALNDVAEAFGFAGESAQNDLYAALKDGSITFNEFNAKLIELSNETGGFADRAKTASSGIATSFGNLRNTAAKGIADIIKKFDELSKEVTGKDIAGNIDGMKHIINAAFKAIGSVVEGTTPVFKVFGSVVSSLITTIKPLTPVLIGMASAYTMHAAINATTNAIKNSQIVIAATTALKKAHTLAVTESTTGYLANAVASKASALAETARSKILAISTAAELLLTKQLKLSQAAKLASAAASAVLGGALKVMMGPVGWVTAGIGALAGAAVAVVKWFKRSTEEGEKFKKEAEELSGVTDELVDSVNRNADSYEENTKNIELASKKNDELAQTVENLASKENLSAGEKEMLKQHIEELNGSIEGLNLAYDEEADALNMSSQELQARIELMKETEAGLAAQERLTEITQEQEEIEAQLAETIAKRKEIEEDGNITKGEAKEATEELSEKEKELETTLENLGIQQAETEQQITDSTENITTAIEEGNLRQITSYEDLEDAHKAIFDSMKETYDDLQSAATDAFDKIDTETEHTMDSMIETMEHNQTQVEKWGENQAKLLEWAGENGYDNFIPYIENMGIDSAAELAVLSEAGDAELKRFADAVENGADVAAGGLKDSLGEGAEEAVENFLAIMGDGATDLRTQIKNSGFDEIGSMIPEGLKEGMDKGAPDVEESSKEMAVKAIHATEDEFGIHSPSKVYKGFGGDITDGLSLGIKTGTSTILMAVRTMFNRVQSNSTSSLKKLNTSFKTHTNIIKIMMVSQFKSIGVNAMSGLNAGLNAGIGRVMNTARGIANRVASTMQKALKIHSPSKVMEMDVGRWIPEGITKGIEGNANSVYRAMENLSSNMIVSTPEQALGLGRMAYSSAMPVATASPNTNAGKSANAGAREVINIETGDVYLDGEKVGDIVWRPVEKNINRNNEIIGSFRG